MRHNDSEPIISRQLRLVKSDGSASLITISIFKPSMEGEDEWQCRYRIDGLKRRCIQEMSMGVDGLQAMFLAIQSIASWIEATQNEPGHEVQWSEGTSFDNLELCEGGYSQRFVKKAQSRVEAILNWEIREAFSDVRDRPHDAAKAFIRLRRRAARRGLDSEITHCLFGLLAVARRTGDTKEALRLAQDVAKRQSSIENVLMCAKEFEKHGRWQEARGWYEQALPRLEPGTALHELVKKKTTVGKGEEPA